MPDLVIGAISGALTDELAAECKAAGAKWALAKVFDATALAGTIALNHPPVPRILRPDLSLKSVRKDRVKAAVKAMESVRALLREFSTFHAAPCSVCWNVTATTDRPFARR